MSFWFMFLLRIVIFDMLVFGCGSGGGVVFWVYGFFPGYLL